MTEIIMDRVNRRDARLLRKWWNSNTPFYHFIKKRSDYKKLYDLVRQAT